jgi:demethylmenaquinone methyltransferase/2-methoxy-6-polyprenyl-1,4-benzoquinol methylase
MFGSIAGTYDLNNHLHSLWMDQAWRRFAVRQAGVRAASRVLDVACGTGDLTEAFARAGAASVIGLDYTPEMLDIARRKQSRLAPEVARRIEYRQGDAQALPLADGSVDIVAIAFGLRNIADPARALLEFRRVLTAGGRLVILEFSRPRSRLVRAFNDLYCRRIMPRTATLISRDRSGAYFYLPASVDQFMSADRLAAMLAERGFTQVRATPLALGICTCYRAVAAAGHGR